MIERNKSKRQRDRETERQRDGETERQKKKEKEADKQRKQKYVSNSIVEKRNIRTDTTQHSNIKVKKENRNVNIGLFLRGVFVQMLRRR
jgi:hypothetical protein